MSLEQISPKILIVDDDKAIQELVIEQFKGQDLVFTAFDNASEVLERAKADPAFLKQFDLIITDFKMPDVDGLEFMRRFREFSLDTPIILMTGTNKVELAVEAIRAGAYDFVVKPIRFEQLNLSIQRGLDLKKLRTQNEILRSTLKSQWTLDGVVGKSPGFRKVLDLARRVAKSSANVLINGESGTGKELIAKSIHQSSLRANAPFVAINCSAIPESLMESELFGHARGSFTGAINKKVGLFEEAHNGTLFLDEIGDLNLALQAKLLRVLQERKIKRVGENAERTIDVRLLAATHMDLKKEVKEKRFREDLYFRLNVIQIQIPPLRERKEDIVPLAQHFFTKYAAQNETPAKGFSKAALEHLLSLQWLGNVRELENAVERAVILSQGPLILPSDLPKMEDSTEVPAVARPASPSLTVESLLSNHAEANGGHPFDGFPTLEEFSKIYVNHVLERVGGVKEKAARILDIDRKTLYRKLPEKEPRREMAAPAPANYPAAQSTH